MTSQFKNTTNTAFSVTFTGQSLKFVFAAPLSTTYYINAYIFYLSLCPSNANWVDLGEFDQGIFTVDYSLCTSPTALSRDAWVTALLGLITIPNSNIINSLAASSQTDVVVGWNATTRQLTNLGNSPRERLYVYQSANQAVAAVPGSTILFNVVVDDPLSSYNPATGIYTIPEQGYYIFGSNVNFAVISYLYVAYNGAALADGIAWNGSVGLPNAIGGYWMNAGDTLRVRGYAGSGAATTTSVLNKSNSFFVKRIV